MKKFNILLIAIVLILGFSQCKKTDVAPTTVDNGIFITFEANYGGEKSGFNPNDGSFMWSAGTEYVNVGGSNSGYLGQLTGTGDESNTREFSGNIGTPVTGETLYFIYLGNGDHANATTLNFSAQDGTLANLTDYHIAVGSATYSGQTSFSATLAMKTAFARINMSGFSDEVVYVHGDNVYASATIDYNTGAITGDALGYINVGAANNDKFVAFIPSTTTETTIKFDSGTKKANVTFENGIQAGRFYAKSDGSALTIPTVSSVENTKGLFAVAGTEEGAITKMVRFSPGNLKYTRESTSVDWSTGTWSFQSHQYGVVETEDVSSEYAEQTAIGLFGWGTTGQQDAQYNSKETYYMPNNTGGVGPGAAVAKAFGPTGQHDLSVSRGSDWGWCIGGSSSPWFTLSATEWEYLFANNMHGWATVAGVSGYVFVESGTIAQTYNESAWIEAENSGAMFLPCTGFRYTTQITNGSNHGYYWSSTTGAQDTGAQAYDYRFNDETMRKYSHSRYNAKAVRLVVDVNE